MEDKLGAGVRFNQGGLLDLLTKNDFGPDQPNLFKKAVVDPIDAAGKSAAGTNETPFAVLPKDDESTYIFDPVTSTFRYRLVVDSDANPANGRYYLQDT